MAANYDLAKQLLQISGIAVAGDWGPFTIWTNKNNRIVVAPRSPPNKPPSELQIRQRNRFQLAIANWKLESASTKAAWELLTIRLSLLATGLNLYMSLSMNPDNQKLTDACRQTGITLSPPPVVPV